MSVITLEAIVEHGQIKLSGNVHLPENTRVYVIVPSEQMEHAARVVSPRLAHPDQAADFEMQVVEETPHAGV